MAKAKKVEVLDKVMEAPPISLAVRDEAQTLINEMCKEIGMGLRDYLTAIKAGLLAEKMVYDKEGNVMGCDVDHPMRIKAATLGLEVEGYLTRAKNSNDSGGIDKMVAQQIMIEVRNIVVNNAPPDKKLAR